MSSTSEKLAQECSAARKAATEAVAWLAHNADYVGVSQKSLKRDFMRWGLAVSKLEKSARRPMSIAVFGPSQAGKSYLSSALLGSEAQPMKVVLGGREYDFLDDINPGKNQVETTGLVTRFTRQPLPASLEGFPVHLRLLTQTDLVKVFANTYFLDFDPKMEIPVGEEAVTAVLADLERASQPQQVDTLDPIEIDDVRNYVETAFERRPTVEALRKANFWERFEELAPRLSIDQRVRGYAFLWGGLHEFSRAYLMLYDVLRRVGFAEEVYCSVQGLVPRETTILDVAQLAQMLSENAGTVAVRAGSTTVEVRRPQLTAVVAELVMQVKTAKWPFLEHTDLLDFPGARSREVNKDPVNDVKDLEKVGREFFRRGKVAYLFDRYRNENDITAMLLCLEPGNQNVRTLTDVVNSWVHTSLGDTPKKRARVPATLFFVFTKFDTHFRHAAGVEVGTDLRWTTAIEPPLVDMFARGRDPWPLEWVPGQAFNNCYWLRNPGWPAHDIIRYDGKREVGYVERMQGERTLDDLRAVYLQNALVQRHFNDPSAAWDAALALNDGGIGYLAAALEPVCKPGVKLAQIEAKLSDLRRQMHEALSEYYEVDDSGDAERKKRRERASVAVREFRGVVERERFGHLLSEMQIDVGAILLRLRRQAVGGGNGINEKPAVDYDDILDSLGLKETLAAGNGGKEIAPQFRDLADSVMEYWTERMREMPKQDRLLSHLGLDSKTAEVIVAELLDGAVKQKLPTRIAKIIADNRPPIDADPQAAYRPARAACDLINGFVMRMGYDAMKPEDRPQLPDKDLGRLVPIFQPLPRPERNERLILPGPERKARLVREWLRAFLELVQKNSEIRSDRRVDPEQNERLGRVLQVLSP